MKSTMVNITDYLKQLLNRRVIICCLMLCGWFFSGVTFNAQSSQNERADDETKKANFFSIRDEFYKQWPAMKARQIPERARQGKTNTERLKGKETNRLLRMKYKMMAKVKGYG